MITLGPSEPFHATQTFADSGLTPGTTYVYDVTAVNGPYSSSTPSGVSVTVPGPGITNPGGAPNAPFQLTAEPDATGHGITFSFFDSADNETGFVVQRATNPDGPFTQIATLGPAFSATHVHYDDTSTTPGTTYYYTAFAVNGPYQSSTPAAVSATAPGTSAGSGITLDPSFAAAGDFRDAGALPAVRVATSPDGRKAYALSTGLHDNNTGYVGPIIDVLDAVTGASFGHFSLNQQLTVPFGKVAGLAVQTDGKLVVAGNAGGSIVVARFNADGSPDTTFGNAAGELVVDYARGEQVADVAIARNGQIYVGGWHGVFSTPVFEFFAVRLNPDGSLDRGFGFNGISKGGGLGKGGHAGAIAIDPADGSAIVVGSFLANAPGSFQSALAGARLLPSGVDTNDFLYDEGAAGSGAQDVIVQADRKIVVVGQNRGANEALRLNPDGTRDRTWIGPTPLVTPGGGFGTAAFNGVAPLADGSYVVVGFHSPDDTNANTNALIARLASDGTFVDGTAGVIERHLPDGGGSSNADYADVALSPTDPSVFAAGGDHAELLVSKYRLA